MNKVYLLVISDWEGLSLISAHNDKRQALKEMIRRKRKESEDLLHDIRIFGNKYDKDIVERDIYFNLVNDYKVIEMDVK